jgi:hypothetical protein
MQKMEHRKMPGFPGFFLAASRHDSAKRRQL